jgi:hypothetical protein
LSPRAADEQTASKYGGQLWIIIIISNLSEDRSTASSKTIPPLKAI